MIGIGAEDCLPAEEATPPAAVSFDMQSFPSLSQQRDEQLQSSPADTAGQQQKCSLEPEASLLTSEIISWPNPGPDLSVRVNHSRAQKDRGLSRKVDSLEILERPQSVENKEAFP